MSFSVKQSCEENPAIQFINMCDNNNINTKIEYNYNYNCNLSAKVQIKIKFIQNILKTVKI